MPLLYYALLYAALPSRCAAMQSRRITAQCLSSLNSAMPPRYCEMPCPRCALRGIALPPPCVA